MKINSIRTTTQNFSGSSSKVADFLINQGHHIWTQGTSFFVCSALYPIENFGQFLRTKFFIDLGEYLSNLCIKNPNTTSRQCTNMFSAMTDCSKDVVRWTRKIADKFKN